MKIKRKEKKNHNNSTRILNVYPSLQICTQLIHTYNLAQTDQTDRRPTTIVSILGKDAKPAEEASKAKGKQESKGKEKKRKQDKKEKKIKKEKHKAEPKVNL